MAEDGLIRREALPHIYKEVDTFMKQAINSEYAKNLLSKGLSTFGRGFAGAAGAGGAVALGAYLKNKLEKGTNIDKGRAAILKSRDAVVSQFSDPSDKSKAQARFNEIMLYSPHIAMNTPLASKIVKDNLHSGISDDKAQMLALVQSQYTKDVSDQLSLSDGLGKSASMRPEAVGELAADVFLMSKIAAPITGKDIGKYLKTVLTYSSVPLVAGALAGTVGMVGNKMKERELKDQLDHAFNVAIKQAPGDKKEFLNTNMDAARQSFNALVHFAPHVALQPHAARAFMIRMINHYEQGGMDISDVKNLTEIEKNISGSGSRVSPFMEGFTGGFKMTSGMKGLDVASQGMMSNSPVEKAQAHG